MKKETDLNEIVNEIIEPEEIEKSQGVKYTYNRIDFILTVKKIDGGQHDE